MKKAIEFWKKKPSVIESMFLRADARAIDMLERQEILALLPPFEKRKVLDLGAGIGRFTQEFAKEAAHVTAVDAVAEFTEENQRKNSAFQNITYLTADAMKLRFGCETFDLIFINWLFMYLEDEEVAELSLRFKHWLKPEGALFIRETCAATRQPSRDSYPVHYRGISFYHQILDPLFTLRNSGSIQTYIDRYANPFHIYWLYQTSTSNYLGSLPLAENSQIPLHRRQNR